MFGIFTGTVANAAMVIAGTAVGCLFKMDILKKIGDRVFQAFGFFVMVLGISGAIALNQPIFTLLSLVIGIAFGEIVDLDDKFTRLGNFLQSRFSKSSDSKFAEGFIQASLLFCIGSMSIMGAMEAGLQNQHSIYLTKGLIDGISAIGFSMGAGIGVAFSALAVLVYQGLMVLGANIISGILTDEIIALSTQIGSLSLIALSFNMLGLTKIKVANFLPAMFIPILYQAILVMLGMA
ncbi:MAG: DUF554 domain-containing protein [Firmicutes bacterium]|nr:DUF554 domain-containing protein [Bacillota bacterium]